MSGGGALVWLALLAVAVGGRGTAGTGASTSTGTSPSTSGGRKVRRPLRGAVRDGLGAARDHGPHQGFDIFPTEGDGTVYAYGDGVVADIIDGRQSTLEARRRAGLYMEVAGSDGTLHRYLHLERVSVEKGQKVQRDQHIATIAGTHLHFEIRQGNSRTGKPLVPDFG